jgi:hypothetical protein
MRVCPCKGCPDAGCGEYHSICEKYLLWKKEHDEMMAKKEEPGLTINEANKRKYWRNMKHERKKRYV